jgi:acetyl esterase/lipase
MMQSSEYILTEAPPKADARIAYGLDEFNFTDLRLPHEKNNTVPKSGHPIVMFIHGGYWRAKYDLTHAGHACAALARSGLAVWQIEYRRVGNPGGGWPGTFEDITSAYQYLPQISRQYQLDSKRVVVIGHSAGGQLALSLAARQPSLRGAISLAGVVDLRRAYELHLSNDAVAKYLGGAPDKVDEHYKEASPIEVPVPKVQQRLIHGTTDETVPIEISRHYVDVKKKWKEDVQLKELPKTGHFELIDPKSSVWKIVEDTVQALLR